MAPPLNHLPLPGSPVIGDICEHRIVKDHAEPRGTIEANAVANVPHDVVMDNIVLHVVIEVDAHVA